MFLNKTSEFDTGAFSVPREGALAGFGASVAMATRLVFARWWLPLASLGQWCVVLTLGVFYRGDYRGETAQSFVLALVFASTTVSCLRTLLVGEDCALPTTAMTRSVAVAVTAFTASAAAFLLVNVAWYGPTRVLLGGEPPQVPVLFGILAASLLGLLPDLAGTPGAPQPKRLVAVTTLLLVAGPTAWAWADGTSTQMILWPVVIPMLVSNTFIAVLPAASAQTGLPWLRALFHPPIVPDTALAGPADPILALRRVLAIGRTRRVGMRLGISILAALAGHLVLALFTAGGTEMLGFWLLLGMGFAMFPVSMVDQSFVAALVETPVPGLAVQHAFLREAAVQLGLTLLVAVPASASWLVVVDGYSASAVEAEAPALLAWGTVVLAPAAWLVWGGVRTRLAWLAIAFLGFQFVAIPAIFSPTLRAALPYGVAAFGLVALLAGEVVARRRYRPYTG